jgi:glycosyltransferase involved in cell wall biosynthesis
MRIVIDLQGAQSKASSKRGIGRYTMSLARAIARNRNDHQIFLVLSGLFPETIEPIRAAFDDLVPQENIRVWYAPDRVAFSDSSNHWRRSAAEYVREAFLASIEPDIILISSLFEGYGDDAITSVGLLSETIPTAVILYDLIPYIYRDPYLENPNFKSWYLEKIEHVRRCDLWLAISESSQQEGIEHLDLASDWAINVSTDADECFQPFNISTKEETSLRTRYGLNRPFVMYTGGIDHRKNIEGLIRAFASLPKGLRDSHQLAIVCSAQPESKHELEQLAEKLGMSKRDLILTGFVPESDLLTLYNLCSLFVFPSWHEGFGLPALEAMRCGAPVIASNTSSLPEVIGWEEALFNPHADDEIAKLIARALSDMDFREALIENGQAQSVKFSWDRSAKRAIEAMERLLSERKVGSAVNNEQQRRPKLAYVSPLPSERSGIADYSAELLPELASHYDIDVIVAQEKITDPWINAHCTVRSAQWLIEHADHYDRVLYHFGNSTFHQHMFDLLRTVPGVVVLHDFFLSGIVAHMDFHGVSPGHWARELYRAHGSKGVYDLVHAANHADVIWQYPCSLSVIQDSLGLIVHSSSSLRLAERWFGGALNDWAVIPLLRNPRISEDSALARRALGFKADDFVVCTFGMLGPTKLNKSLLEAWINSSLAEDKRCYLIFVGENGGGDYGQDLLITIRGAKCKNKIRIAGWTEKEIFRQYLAAADVGVQLRTQSRGETSAAVLDCMNYGLPTIVNANGSMADIDEDAVWKLPDEFSNEQLIEALETLRKDKPRRQRVGEAARNMVLQQHDPRNCAELYRDVIESFYFKANSRLQALPDAIAEIPGQPPGDADLIKLADFMAHNFPPRNRKRQLLVDISELAQRDSKSGIQRVVRNLLSEWLHNPPENYRVEPVYATEDQSYRYARNFTAKFMEIPREAIINDEPVEYALGDVFLGLDFQPQVVPSQQSFYQALRQQGVKVKFVVYDLLSILSPHHFVHGAAEGFTRWLEVAAENDGALCISQSVANELSEWVDENAPVKKRPFKIDWFHLGADSDNSLSSKGLPPDKAMMLDQIGCRPSFLMVATLEPRKGHLQTLEAFENLWQSGSDINLVIVGKQGWMMEKFVDRLRSHPEQGHRLFWLEGISDEYLEKVYAASTCLIAASFGEGFGLPLIEAAQHKMPIIARDIPVFREVAGDYAFYFNSEKAEGLAQTIQEWLELYKKDNHPRSDAMPWLTWKESADQLLKLIIPNQESGSSIKKETM